MEYVIRWHTKQTKYTRKMDGNPFTVNASSKESAKWKAIDEIYKTSGFLIGAVVIDSVTEH